KEFLAKHPRGYRGKVSRLMPIADRAKGAVPVRVLVEKGEISDAEAGQYLRPDLSATGSFLRADGKQDSPGTPSAGEGEKARNNKQVGKQGSPRPENKR